MVGSRNLDYGNRINFLKLRVQSTCRNNFTLKKCQKPLSQIMLHFHLFPAQALKSAKISRKDTVESGVPVFSLGFACKKLCFLRNVIFLFWVSGFFPTKIVSWIRYVNSL